MRGRIESGQLVTLDPSVEPKVDDAVLVRCRGNVYVHIIHAMTPTLDRKKVRYTIGNNRGGINGRVGRDAIFGVVTKVED